MFEAEVFRALTDSTRRIIVDEHADGVELFLRAERPPGGSVVPEGDRCRRPAASFAVDDAETEYERLREAGVRFIQPPTKMGPATTAIVDDTCGNLIQIAGI